MRPSGFAAVRPLKPFGRLQGCIERSRQKLSHLADLAAAARRKTQGVERDGDIFLPGNAIADCLCQLRLAGADIARKDHQRRAPLHIVQERVRVAMVTVRPRARACGIHEHTEQLGQARLCLVQPTSRANRLRADRSGKSSRRSKRSSIGMLFMGVITDARCAAKPASPGRVAEIIRPIADFKRGRRTRCPLKRDIRLDRGLLLRVSLFQLAL